MTYLEQIICESGKKVVKTMKKLAFGTMLLTPLISGCDPGGGSTPAPAKPPVSPPVNPPAASSTIHSVSTSASVKEGDKTEIKVKADGTRIYIEGLGPRLEGVTENGEVTIPWTAGDVSTDTDTPFTVYSCLNEVAQVNLQQKALASYSGTAKITLRNSQNHSQVGLDGADLYSDCSEATSLIRILDTVGGKEDTKSPVVGIPSIENGKIYTSHITSLIHSETDDVGVVGCQVSTDGGVTKTDTPCNGKIGSLSSVEGLNDWRVYATDAAGNVGEKKVVFTVDTSVEPELGAITNTSISGQCNKVNAFNLKSGDEGKDGVSYSVRFTDDAGGDLSGLIVDSLTGEGSYIAGCNNAITGSLEASVMRGEELNKTILPVNIGYISSIGATLTRTIKDEDVTWIYDATSDGGNFDDLYVKLNGVNDVTFDNINDTYIGMDIKTPMRFGENSIAFGINTFAGDSNITSGNFHVPTKSQFHSDTKAILDANADKYQTYVENGTVTGGSADCGSGDINYDFKVTKLDGTSKVYIAYEENADILECLKKPHLYQSKNEREHINTNTTNYVESGF